MAVIVITLLIFLLFTITADRNSFSWSWGTLSSKQANRNSFSGNTHPSRLNLARRTTPIGIHLITVITFFLILYFMYSVTTLVISLTNWLLPYSIRTLEQFLNHTVITTSISIHCIPIITNFIIGWLKCSIGTGRNEETLRHSSNKVRTLPTCLHCTLLRTTISIHTIPIITSFSKRIILPIITHRHLSTNRWELLRTFKSIFQLTVSTTPIKIPPI